jgi:hypothetical protein
MAKRLAGGSFMGNFIMALENAVDRCAWPAGSTAFHSPARLAETARRLAEAGHQRHLVAAVAPLAKAVETSPDDRTTKAALRALRSLSWDVACLEHLLSLEDFRCEALESLHKSGEQAEATELASYLQGAEAMFCVAQAALDESRAFVPNAPSVRALAEAFATICRFDGELTVLDLPKVLALVPVGPISAVIASLSGGKRQELTFQDFAQHVYGTPTMLGWWPSLMEETAALWAAPGHSALLPGLLELVSLFEGAAHGASGVGGEALLQEVLPALGLPTEGEVAEEAFTEIHGEGLLDLHTFAMWLSCFCARVSQREEETALELRGLEQEAVAVGVGA